MANPFKAVNDDPDRVYPPQGHSPEQVANRRQFWIAHGNSKLVEGGMSNLQWRCIDGHYFIEPR